MNVTFAEQNNMFLRILNYVKERQITLQAREIRFNTMLNYIITLIIQFQNKQRLLIDSIALGQGDPNHPGLLPPEIFFNELSKIRSRITARDLDLPLPLDTNTLSMFYHISTAEARIVENQLIVSFTLPLVNTQNFFLYKATSLP
jgi:hypothetical protein